MEKTKRTPKTISTITISGTNYINTEVKSNRMTFDEAVELYDKFLLLQCPTSVFKSWAKRHHGQHLEMMIGPYVVNYDGDVNCRYGEELEGNLWMKPYILGKYECLKELTTFYFGVGQEKEMSELQEQMFKCVKELEEIKALDTPDLNFLRAEICGYNPTDKIEYRKYIVSALGSDDPDIRQEAMDLLDIWDEVYGE